MLLENDFTYNGFVMNPQDSYVYRKIDITVYIRFLWNRMQINNAICFYKYAISSELVIILTGVISDKKYAEFV